MNERDQQSNSGAGHEQCDRCAIVHGWFLSMSLDRPEEVGGWCISCQTTFCSAHADVFKKCIICGTELFQPRAERLEREWVKIPGFLSYKPYKWPERCVCCFSSAEATATVISELDKQALTAGHAKVGKSGNVEVNYDSYTKKASVTIHVPYCEDCKRHDRLRNIGFPMMGCPLSLVALFLITGFILSLFGLVSLFELKFANLPLAFQIIGFIILPVSFVIGYFLKRLGDKKRKESCQKAAVGLIRSFPIELNVDKMGFGSLEFAQPRYAEAFTQANSQRPGIDLK